MRVGRVGLRPNDLHGNGDNLQTGGNVGGVIAVRELHVSDRSHNQKRRCRFHVARASGVEFIRRRVFRGR